MSALLRDLGLAGWLALLAGAVVVAVPPAAAADAPPPAGEEEREDDGPERTARGEYNAGLALLASGDHEGAARAFLRARDRAGPDPELRYRAAFNLGLALAEGAGDASAGSGPDGGDGAAEEEEESAAGREAPADSPAEAARRTIAALRRSAAWFADAVRLAPPGDDDARVNLELVSRRILALQDSLRDAERLPALLDRLIDDQRSIRDRLRGVLAEVEAEGAAAAPLGFRDAHVDLASRERALMAEVGDAIDVAAGERLFIEETPEEERTPEDRLRAWQLAAAAAELERARQSLGDARRRLRRLEGEGAHRRAEAALADLKRARERLLDPVAVLGRVARDQAGILAHTAVLAAAAVGGPGQDAASEGSGPDGVDEGSGPGGEARPPPRWLTPRHLAERQEDAAERAREVLARLEAVAGAAGAADGAGAPSADSGARPEADPGTERTRRAAAEAAPVLDRAVGAMRAAIADLGAGRADRARDAGREALDGVRQAIEAFAGVRQLVELAHRDQRGIVELLAGRDGEAPAPAAPAEMVLGLAAGNERRLERLEGRLEEERADALAADGGERAPGGPDPAEGDARRRSIEDRYRHAGDLRGRALAGLRALDRALAGAAAGRGSAAGTETGAEPGGATGAELRAGAARRVGDETGAQAGAREAAEATLAALDELRRLFFSIVEHLEALRSDQAETRDRTTRLQVGRFTDTDRLAEELGLATERQREHERLATALARTLAEQADAAGAASAVGAEGTEGAAGAPAPDPAARERLGEAAGEVRAAGGRMLAAGARLADASSRAASPALEPVLDDQMAAIEHLENALRALAAASGGGEPPPASSGDEPQPATAGSAAERPAGEDEALSRREALRRLQAIRDREAERRRAREAPGREPVEKDW